MSEIKDFYNEFHSLENHLLNRIMEDVRYRFLQKEVENFPGKLIVIGCGSKREMTLASSIHSEVWGIDISELAIEKTRKNFPGYNYKVMDASNMTFEENTFDVVVCSEVIEHLPDQNGFLASVAKIVKPGGTFILTTPNWWSFYGLARFVGERITGKPLTADNQPIDAWARPDELLEKVQSKGFEVMRTRGLWYYPPFGKGKYRLPALITYPVYLIGRPVDKMLSVIAPKWGHMIALVMVNKKAM